MRPFKFRAEAALDLRRERDKEAQRVRAAAQREADEAAAAVAAAERACETARADAARALASACDITNLTWHRNWMARSDERLRAEREVLARRRIALDQATERAIHARRQLRALERLKERAREAYEGEMRRVEQRDLDEFATLKAASDRRTAKETR